MNAVAHTIESAKDLLALVQLTGIRTYEVRGRRLSGDGGDGGDGGGGEVLPEVSVRISDSAIEVRMRIEIVTDEAELVADVAVKYSLAAHVGVTQAAAEEFVDRVALMAAYPFVRESVFATASRLGVKVPVLGLLFAGSFHAELHVPTPGEAPAGDVQPGATPSALAKELGVSAEAIRAWLRGNGAEPQANGRWLLTDAQAESVRGHFA